MDDEQGEKPDLSDVFNGEIECELSGKTVILRRSIGAGLALDRAARNHGLSGIGQLVDALLAYNYDVTCEVVAAGLGVKPEKVREAVFETGIMRIAPYAVRFIHSILRGSSKPEEENKPVDPLPAA